MRMVKRPNPAGLSGIEQLFDEFFAPFGLQTHVQQSLKPLANIEEEEKGYRLELLVPGFKKEEIDIELNDKHLIVKGNHTENQEERKGKSWLREFHKSSFERRFLLPDTADVQGIQAEAQEGLLKVWIPKKEEAQTLAPRRIDIK